MLVKMVKNAPFPAYYRVERESALYAAKGLTLTIFTLHFFAVERRLTWVVVQFVAGAGACELG